MFRSLTPIYFFLFLTLIVSCGDSPFLSNEEPSKAISGVSGISSYQGKLFLKDIEIIPRYTKKVELYDSNSLNFILINGSGELVDPEYSIKLMLWMPDHGHGSYPIVLTKISKGVYSASEIYFTMPGKWDLHFQLIDEGQIVAEELWPIAL
ncbi:MAG: hypothetical protein BM556_17410 [Bacteriovorax sp. MedPE-SWde]|nr:MAG: hypothetical protein BM556_17410 [Bacteriovorax sp. MedPE-SWde]